MANLREFFNKISNNNRIFTREDIGNMSSNEFQENEKAIDYQLANLGVPTNSDMALSDDVVYVHSYTRDDGTKVKAHYRSISGHITGAASNMTDNSKIYLYKKGLSNFNHTQNSKYPDARDMMDISIYGPKNIQNTDNYKFISSKFNEKLSKDLNVNIPRNWDGIVYNVNSSLSKSIATSPEFLQEVVKQKSTNFSNGSFQISLNNDQNLFRSIHNATVLNPHIDKDGYFNGLIFDLYDFKKNKYIKNSEYDKSTFFNNSAYRLQELKLIKNYYTLIPIKTKLPF